MAKTVSVAAIKDGTVIDHIPPGQALKIIHLLQLDHNQYKVTIGLHLTSSSMEFKELVKIEDRFLTAKEAHDVAVFAPHATISIIKNYKIASKINAQLPDKIEKILVCPNNRCITHYEHVPTQFLVQEFKQKVFLRCNFCEKLFERDQIKEYNI